MKIEEGGFYKTRDGRKVGPMVWRGPPCSDFICDQINNWWKTNGDTGGYAAPSETDLVAMWTEDGPVRVVTRKEIIQGRFGIVSVGCLVVVPDCESVDAKPSAEIAVTVGGMGMVFQQPTFTPAELRAASATFLALADALDEVA